MPSRGKKKYSSEIYVLIICYYAYLFGLEFSFIAHEMYCSKAKHTIQY
jgi:hypothetical protein